PFVKWTSQVRVHRVGGLATVLCEVVGFSACGTVGAAAVWSASSESTFGPPVAFTAVALIVLLPAFSVAVMVTVCQVSQLAVAGNETPPIASEPLTLMSMGRSAVEPLAYRNESLVVPADETFTVHWTELPATFV